MILMDNQLEPLNPKKVAFIAVDLQKDLPMTYHPYPYATITENAGKLARAFEQAGALNVFFKVDTTDGKDMLNPIADRSMVAKGAADIGDRQKFDQLTPELDCIKHALRITKHQWGSFYGTELDLQLRRRGIDTIVLSGVAIGFDVDTTAREAYQHGYHIIFAEDAMGALSEQEYEYEVNYIFPFMGRVRKTDDIINAGWSE